MIKMVVSSFYNTLINKEEAIPMSTMLEIERIRNQGVAFSVCTNRLAKELLEYNRDFPFIDYIISLNGAYIYDVINEKCLYKSKISNSIIEKIKILFHNKKIIYYTKNDFYTELPQEDIYKIEIELSKKDISNINEIKDLNVTTSILKINKKNYLEITANNTNMYLGILQILNRKSITEKEVLAIIGNISDKEIVNHIENTYRVSNSPKEIKQLTGKKTKSNNNKGLEYMIKKIIK